jgi:hypothetical protein
MRCVRDIDYRCEDKKKTNKVGYLKGNITLDPALDMSRLLLSEYSDHHSQENKPFSLEMHLKIQLSRRGLKLSNSKPSCKVSAVHFFGKKKRSHQWLSEIKLSLISALFIFLFQDQPLFLS